MKGQLLLVDDEPLLLKGLKNLLVDSADEIFIAENGLEALKVVDAQEIHCIVCDINMPRMNGIEFVKELRSRQFEVPIIFYTGHGQEELMLEVAKYGA